MTKRKMMVNSLGWKANLPDTLQQLHFSTDVYTAQVKSTSTPDNLFIFIVQFAIKR